MEISINKVSAPSRNSIKEFKTSVPETCFVTDTKTSNKKVNALKNYFCLG